MRETSRPRDCCRALDTSVHICLHRGGHLGAEAHFGLIYCHLLTPPFTAFLMPLVTSRAVFLSCRQLSLSCH